LPRESRRKRKRRRNESNRLRRRRSRRSKRNKQLDLRRRRRRLRRHCRCCYRPRRPHFPPTSSLRPTTIATSIRSKAYFAVAVSVRFRRTTTPSSPPRYERARILKTRNVVTYKLSSIPSTVRISLTPSLRITYIFPPCCVLFLAQKHDN